MKRVKVLMLTSTFPRWQNDMEPRFIFDFSKAVAKYCDVTVLAPAYPGAKDYEQWDGVNIVRYHYMAIHGWERLCYPGAIMERIKRNKYLVLEIPFLLFSLWKYLLLNNKQYDLIHAHWFIPQGIVQSFCRGTFVVTGHGTDVTTMNKGILSFLKQRVISKATYITVVSNRLLEILSSTYFIDQENISTIPMGCNLDKFSPINKANGIFPENGRKRVLFVGRLAEVKGVRFLIDAMDYVNADLFIIGTGEIKNDLEVYARKKKNKIFFLGPKSHNELPVYYASADVCVVPSIVKNNGETEGFGLVALEAMASGTPVVASRSGGIMDLIEDNKNGLLAEPGNSIDIAKKINMVLENDELFNTLRSEGLKSAKKYSYDIIAQRYLRIYYNVLNMGTTVE